MIRLSKKTVFSALTCLMFLLSVFGGSSLAQETMDDQEKLYKEIAGNYEFEYEGQYVVFVVTFEDGNLKVGPEGEEPDTMQPVEDAEMTFLAYSPDGDEYTFKFKRDEDGTINTCIVSVAAMGIEIEGHRIKI